MSVTNYVDKDSTNAKTSDFIKNRFIPKIVYVNETGNIHTRVCAYNYFSELFPDVKTGAMVHIWFFNASGKLIANRAIPIGYKGQLQFDVSSLGINFEGAAGLSMVPDTIPEMKPALIGTGFYAYYHDDSNHADFSHEWESMKFESNQSDPWLCVVRPLSFPDTQIVVMSSYFGTNEKEGTADWVLRLRNDQGKILLEKKMPPIPPRGIMRFKLSDILSNLQNVISREKVLGLEVVGSNIQGPFTWVSVSSGDFNIHHFC